METEKLTEEKNSTSALINLNVNKAGLDQVDEEKINKVIQEASKGSHYYLFQLKRQQRINDQIFKLRKKIEKLSEKDKLDAFRKADELINQIEVERVLNKIIVHLDMDMFFASVEIKKNPSLSDKPVAVGGLSMISTSNYIARKYGVRSAMAGFIAKKLCPNLILIKPDFKSYCEESSHVMKILSEYDPNMRNFSLDEVYLDLTNYVFNQYSLKKNVEMKQLMSCEKLDSDVWLFAFELVNDIRTRVFNETKLTVSAGISCNTMLAKVCTDINKPNGQFMIEGNREQVMNFVANTPLRKFCGIGPVKTEILKAFGIVNGIDLFHKKDLIINLFSEFNSECYFQIYLGIGNAFLGSEEAIQKSHSRERTVSEISDFDEICNYLKKLASRISDDLKSHSQLAKTVTLKLKKISFEVFLKSRTIKSFTNDENVIFNVVKELLSQEFTKSKQDKYRLIGIKVSNLSDEGETENDNQITLHHLFKPKTSTHLSDKLFENNKNETNFECVLCQESFSDAESLDVHKSCCFGDFEPESDFFQSLDEEIIEENLNESSIQPENNVECQVNSNAEFYSTCPVCNSSKVFCDNADLNRHIDVCLNRNVCAELTQLPCSIASTSQQTNNVKLNSNPKTSNRKIVKSNNKKIKLDSSEISNPKNTLDFYFR